MTREQPNNSSLERASKPARQTVERRGESAMEIGEVYLKTDVEVEPIRRSYTYSTELASYTKGIPRVDIVGGRREDVEAALIALAVPRLERLGKDAIVCVIDVGGENITRELCLEANEMGHGAVDWEISPKQLIELQQKVDSRRIPDLLAASMANSSSREDHFGANEKDIFRDLCSVIEPPQQRGDPSTLEQIHAGLVQLSGRKSPLLTLEQSEDLDDAFTRDRREENKARIANMRAHVASLLEYDDEIPTRPKTPGQPSLYNFTVSDMGGLLPQDRINLLTNMMTVNLAKGFPFGKPEVVMVVGAEKLDPESQKRLSRICERSGTQQVFVYDGTSDETLQVLSQRGAAMGILQVSNAQEAQKISGIRGDEFQWVTTGTSDSENQSKKPKAPDEEKKWLKRKDEYETSTSESSNESYQRMPDIDPRDIQNLKPFEMLIVTHDGQQQHINFASRSFRTIDGGGRTEEVFVSGSVLDAEIPEEPLLVERVYGRLNALRARRADRKNGGTLEINEKDV